MASVVDLINVLDELANMAQDADDYAAVDQYREQVITAWARQCEHQPDNDTNFQELAIAHVLAGMAYAAEGRSKPRIADARTSFRQALKSFRALLKRELAATDKPAARQAINTQRNEQIKRIEAYILELDQRPQLLSPIEPSSDPN